MSDKIKKPEQYLNRITDWPAKERPIERLKERGAENLTDAELLAILIRTGTGNNTAVDIAHQLLVQFKGLHQLSVKPLTDIQKFKGIGPAKERTHFSRGA